MGVIQGVVYSSSVPSEPPIVLVVSPAKYGKSILPISLMGWPASGYAPIVVAADASGPDSCAKLGVPVPHIKVRDQVGKTYKEKLASVQANLQSAFAGGQGATLSTGERVNSIVIDCASTMCEYLLEEAARVSNNSDPRAGYGYVLRHFSSFFFRVLDLKVPTVWIAWLREGAKDDNTGKFVMGGASLPGDKTRKLLEGRSNAIVLLDKQACAQNDPNRCSDGYARLFHTKPYNGINCEGRYNLPNPLPASLAHVFHYMLQGAPQAQQSQVQANGAPVQQ